MGATITDVNENNFESEVLNFELPVLVDFWAEWCQPCKMLAPLLDDMKEIYSGRLKIVKVDVEENGQLAAKFGVRGIPTLMLFKNGELEASKVGRMNKSELTAFLNSNL